MALHIQDWIAGVLKHQESIPFNKRSCRLDPATTNPSPIAPKRFPSMSSKRTREGKAAKAQGASSSDAYADQASDSSSNSMSSTIPGRLRSSKIPRLVNLDSSPLQHRSVASQRDDLPHEASAQGNEGIPEVSEESGNDDLESDPNYALPGANKLDVAQNDSSKRSVSFQETNFEALGTDITVDSNISNISNSTNKSRKSDGYPKFGSLRGYSRAIITERLLKQNKWNELELELVETLKGIEKLQFTIGQDTLKNVNAKWPDMKLLQSVQDETSPSLHGELEDIGLLQWVVTLTKRCTDRNDIEAGWNSFVHGNVLSIASEWSIHREALGLHNVTTAGLKAAMRPIKGKQPQPGRKVDFVFTFLSESIPALLFGRANPALESLVKSPKGESIGDCNAFDFKNTAWEPAAISIETKRLDIPFEGGLAQCAVWLDAQIRLLRMVQALAATNPKSALKMSSIPALPSVLVAGADWFVQLTKEIEDDHTYFWGELGGGVHIGNTTSITGVLQVLNGLLVLIDYAIRIYRPWLADLLAALPDLNAEE